MDKRAAPGMIGETIGEGHYGLVLIGDANVSIDVLEHGAKLSANFFTSAACA